MARLLKRPARFNDSASFEEIAEAINVVISVPNPKKPIANYCFQNGGLETKMAAQSRNVQAVHSTQARKLVTCSYAYKANFIQ